MINSNVNTNASKMSVKNSAVVSSSKSAASAARSNSNSASDTAKKSAKVTPRAILPLDKRTNVETLANGKVKKLDITEKKGDKIEVYLTAPSYREAEHIDDGRQAMTVENGHTYMNLTTPRFQERLFHIMRNLEVNQTPAKMGWKFADNHIEAFNWIINKANSFLTNYFNPDEE